MHKLRLLLTLAIAVSGIVLLASGASAVPPSGKQATSSFDYTKNMHPQGYSAFPNTPNLPGLTFTANSDLAFWGKQRSRATTRVPDPQHLVAREAAADLVHRVLREPGRHRRLGRHPHPLVELAGDRNRIVPAVVRRRAGAAGVRGAAHLRHQRQDEPRASRRGGAEREAERLPGCGSHTATLAPDLKNNRLLVYNQTSGGRRAR